MDKRREVSQDTQRALSIARGVRVLWPFDEHAEGPGSKCPEVGAIVLAAIFGQRTQDGILMLDPTTGNEVHLP